MALVPFPNKARHAGADEDAIPTGTTAIPIARGKMSFLEHLDELRKRIVWALVAIVVGFLIACFFLQRIFDFIMAPMQAALRRGRR